MDPSNVDLFKLASRIRRPLPVSFARPLNTSREQARRVRQREARRFSERDGGSADHEETAEDMTHCDLEQEGERG
jgi:hypothetical protein